jgi:hypothetical protein
MATEMQIPVYASIFFTVALLVTTAYFLMGGLPLLVLKHDVPLDARFIRAFFRVYYRTAFCASLGAAASYAFWGRFAFAAGAAAIAITSMLLARHLIRAMQDIGDSIETSGAEAIARFRQLHSAALSINFAQLAIVVWGLLQLSRELS